MRLRLTRAAPRAHPERYYAEITASTPFLGALVNGADLTLRVPTCPDWTLRQLATHVGRAQRWAAQIVSLRSAQPIAFREVPDGRIPDDPAEHAGWLRAGADRLITVVGQAEDVPVWALAASGRPDSGPADDPRDRGALRRRAAHRQWRGGAAYHARHRRGRRRRRDRRVADRAGRAG